MKKEVTIYTDGGCDNMTGIGGWAFAVSKKYYWSGSCSGTTNNRMELTAIIEAIKTVRAKNKDILIKIVSDSQYCVKGFSEWMHKWVKKDWNKIKNPDLWIELYEIKDKVELSWVRGHSGVPMNEFVDSLCTEMMKQEAKSKE